ncbi:DUF1062 domain-containing protein [Pelagibius litoralis]|uniref:DUF1062 domain-containing protein n=1 Tax=Pelagibius litoralis TaxID=374515 RepID=A0A967EVR7_9PROT|nr:DUF1062 domain-containing protein [Pelagibius litoralis]NIA68239.1 DUF1062 domain-containing protein [Pelagibius litoralis]
MFRVNANGKRLDAWLIYNCTACGNTWNRPVLKRRPVGGIDPRFLAALRANDAETAEHVAFDLADLRRKAERVEVFAEVLLRKEVLIAPENPAERLEIAFALPAAVGLRLDRLLAAELGLARSRLQRLQDTGRLTVSPDGARSLRKAPHRGLRVTIDLSREDDGTAIADAAWCNGAQ